MSLKKGTLLKGGTYEIKRFIASGGFGCTYEAVHLGLDKPVAIKEFFVKGFCNRDETSSQITVGVTSKTALFHKLRKKFVEEARALARLNHPNIVKVSDVFDENGTSYYVMDYIDGESLKNIVETQGPLPETEAVKYILQIADALEYVHKNNRLHLDVKPGNIMINTEGKAQLIDFGASKQYEEESGENTSTVAGFTVGYAPTEQMGNDLKTFIPATDVYSLGATLYNIVSGIKPISAATISSGEKQKPLPEHISYATRHVIEKAMQINKKLRPQSMAEFKELFKTAPKPTPKPQDDDTVRKIDAGDTVSMEKKKEKVNEKKPNAAVKKNVIIAVVALLLCVIGYFVITKLNTSEQTTKNEEKTNKVEASVKDSVERVTGQTFQDADGEDYTYSGEVVDGKPNGKGDGVYSYGNYSGDYKDGLRHGKGSFSSKDGSDKYEGTFSNDQYDEGRITMSDGFYFEGKFKNGQPYNGKWYDRNGKFDSNVVNGK